MLDTSTKKRIDDCRDILVGKLPDPKAQIEQITIALIYKFMNDMDKEAIDLGGKAKFFADYTMPDPENPKQKKLVLFSKYSWDNLFNTKLTATEMLRRYSEAITRMEKNPNIPQLFRDIFKDAYLPYKDAETLKLFLKGISDFEYSHSEKLGDAFEYLLSILGSQGDAGQFRTPRHIIDMIVEIVSPDYDETVFDPACGTAGFLIASYKHILEKNSTGKTKREANFKVESSYETTLENPSKFNGDKLTPDQKKKLHYNINGVDISPDMVRLSLVNMYLHGFANPNITEFDTLTNDSKWNDEYDVIFANPPFMTPKGGIKPHKKFSITSKKSELLFVDFIIEHLKPVGKAGIIVPEGIMFVSQNAYEKVRRKLIENGLICVISLPPGVFKPYASVKTHILILEKKLAKKCKDILFIDINSDGFTQSDTRLAINDNDIPLAKKTYKDFLKNIGNRPNDLFVHNNSISYLVKKDAILNVKGAHLIGRWYKLDALFRRIGSCGLNTDTLGNICDIHQGQSPNMATEPGPYKMVVPAEDRKSADHFTFDFKGVCIPLVSSSGHGKADIKRIHFIEGKFALANTMAALKVKNEKKVNPKYIFEILKEFKEILLTPLMSGATNVTMSADDISKVIIPLPEKKVQDEIVERAAILEGLNKIEQAYYTFSNDLNGKYIEINNSLEKNIQKLTKEASGLKNVNQLYDWLFII